jgi:tRNA1Val (adenine37-N6)-methyltransferase
MFRFKQYTVHQNYSALKVCTDSCLLGALTDLADQSKVLDIGTGTGLLTLMLAQKDEASVFDAVEIDPESCKDAHRNFSESPFSARLKLYQESIQSFCLNKIKKYDLIISNPPFFENHLLSPNPKKNRALHTETLSMNELLQCVSSLLKTTGKFWVLLPPFEMQKLSKLALNFNLFPEKRFLIKHSPKKPTFREIYCFSFELKTLELEETINIFENEVYSDRFAQLLKDYYLIF